MNWAVPAHMQLYRLISRTSKLRMQLLITKLPGENRVGCTDQY